MCAACVWCNVLGALCVYHVLQCMVCKRKVCCGVMLCGCVAGVFGLCVEWCEVCCVNGSTRQWGGVGYAVCV